MDASSIHSQKKVVYIGVTGSATERDLRDTIADLEADGWEVVCVNASDMVIDPGLYSVKPIDELDWEEWMKPVPINEFWVNDDINGMQHAKAKHDRCVKLCCPVINPILFRRLEKAPYSGNCNLRF